MDLKILRRQIETDDSLVRITKTKCAILGVMHGDHWKESVNLVKKRDGTIKISWMGWVPVESVDKKTCNLGHEHQVIKEEKWTWNYCELTKKDIERIREFLV